MGYIDVYQRLFLDLIHRFSHIHTCPAILVSISAAPLSTLGSIKRNPRLYSTTTTMSSTSTRIATPGAPPVNPLTTANLSEQNRRISSSRLPTSSTPAVSAMSNGAQQTDEPEQLAEEVDGLHLDDGDVETPFQQDGGVALKKRKYSADLYQYTKGMWAVITEDIE